VGFRAATYNVLANAYLKPQWYEAVPPPLLRPERRLPALVRRVQGLDADLLCLQEVEGETFAALHSQLASSGYQGHFERKKNKPDGCATFFRTSVFSLQQARRLDYRDAGHLALVVYLETEGRLLGVANTHLRWDPPETPREEQAGYRQALELLQGTRSRCHAWLVCGDFNRTPDSEVVAAFRQSDYEYAHAGRPHIRSCVANGRASLIDYLFFSRELRARPLDPPVVGDETVLPSEAEPSDHLPLVAEFDWV
jgi:mRNA deadenylase 3'-5' endonuclease subunit Ccr4